MRRNFLDFGAHEITKILEILGTGIGVAIFGAAVVDNFDNHLNFMREKEKQEI